MSLAPQKRSLPEKALLRDLRMEQIKILSKPEPLPQLRDFYAKIVDLVNNQRKLQKTDAYTLFGDLFEDCPESSLHANFLLFTETQPNIALPPELLHQCTKVVRTCMSKLTVTHDLQFRGALQKFLAQTIPPTHPTGVNLNSKFNEANTTSIETQPELLLASNSKSVVNSGEYKCYKNFWSLQKYLNNPFAVSLHFPRVMSS